MKHFISGVAASMVLFLLLPTGQTNASSDQVFETEHLWDAKVTIGDRISLGASKLVE